MPIVMISMVISETSSLIRFFFCKINIDLRAFSFLNNVLGKFKNACISVSVAMKFSNCFTLSFSKILLGTTKNAKPDCFKAVIACSISK